MKKLYFLNEEEKERILRLHKSRKIEKTWLNEQHDEELDEQSLGSGVASTIGSGGLGAGIGAGVGAGVGAALGSVIPFAGTAVGAAFGAKLGALIGGTGGSVFGLASSISSGMDRGTFNRTVETACAKDKANAGTPTMDETQILEAAKNLHEYILTPNPFGLGYATQQSRTNIKELLANVPTLPDFCHIMNQYKMAYGTSLLEDLRREIYYDSYYSEVVRVPLLNAIAKSIDLTKKAEKEGGDVDPKTGKKKSPDWEKGQLEFYETYPCLQDIAVASKAKNAVVVQNPSEHDQIVDQTQGSKNRIIDKTTFMLDGTYVTYTDAKRNTLSGKFQCSRDGELTLLFPGQAGMGEEGGISSKYPCLFLPNSSGDIYCDLDHSDNNKAIMDDEMRKTHPIFKTYPEGDIYFNSDGTFVTEKDFDNDIDKTGRFRCRGEKIKAKPFALPKPEPVTPIPDENKKISGMGIVSASAADITEILKCANIGGSVLDQTALNKLYEYIKNNK